ncbi:hypothetical protein WG66_006844 [Moniliophthora roreri]|nr:hypothetical protein WG66_006844 [Moniliophthora roreri]
MDGAKLPSSKVFVYVGTADVAKDDGGKGGPGGLERVFLKRSQSPVSLTIYPISSQPESVRVTFIFLIRRTTARKSD